MLPNVNTLPSDPFDINSIQKWCYNNSTTNCDNEGGLYTWAEAMGLPSSCLTTDCSAQINSPHRGICPSGWHIPNDSEWFALENNLKIDGQACDPNRSSTTNGCYDASPKLLIGGSSGMEIPFAGDRRDIATPDFANGDWSTILLSSSQYNSNYAQYISRALYAGGISTGVGRYFYSKSGGHSIRCLKDNYLWS
jgi:uncharacterized protein (TIGR02145 family)